MGAKGINGFSPLHVARSLEILSALLEHGADPTALSDDGVSVLMWQAQDGDVACVARLLRDPHVRAAVNTQQDNGNTALHHACNNLNDSIVHTLLQAGASTALTNNDGLTPSALIRRLCHSDSSKHAIVTLLEQASDAEKAWHLVKVRRLTVGATTIDTVLPSYLQGRAADGQALSQVALASLMGGNNEDDEHKLRTTLVFVCGMSGEPKGEGMPQDVFRVVMDFLMPSWDPLRVAS